MGTELKIDPELEAVCLPLSGEEFDLLEKQVIRDGCQDALKVWDRDGELILLDGHNRLKICKKHKLPYDTSTIEIVSIDEAVIWIVDNQKGRRNVATKEQQDYISGKRYEAQKNINKFKGNQYTHGQTGSVDNLLYQPKYNAPTAERQGIDEGVSHFTVKANSNFAKGVDAVREVSPELAEKILKPDHAAPTLTKRAVTALPKLKAANPAKFIETVEQIKGAMSANDDQLFKKVVHENLSPGEPTRSEKMIASKRNLKPEHVQYAHEHNIPIKRLKTIPQLERLNGDHKTCSNIWDGVYECTCGAKFELFGADISPRWCPLCGLEGSVHRM